MSIPQKFWIVIPCFNESNRLPVNAITDFLNKSSNVHKYLFVNDGSTDSTFRVINEIHIKFPEKTKVLSLEKNKGKAEAIRLGFNYILENEVDFDYIGFMDADLSTPLEEIENIEKAVETYSKPGMIIGSRIKLFGSTNITRSDRRHYVGRIIATLISKSLQLPIYDTQCGFKFFQKDLAKELFKETFISRWLFDVELLFRLLQLKGRDGINGILYELPVSQWHEKGDSRIPLSYALKMPFELMKIRRKYR